MFDYKIHLIGYYTSPRQNMAEEQTRVEEAKELATLLGRTFSTINTSIIKDEKFVEALSAKTVFIFNDEQKNLYAYYPIKGIARLTNVVYDRKSINPAPFEVKGWFVPGSILAIGNRSNSYQANKERKHKKTFTVVRHTGESEEYPFSDLHISNVRSDILIFFNKRTLPLDISEDTRVSFSLLYKIIGHPWIYLEEYDTDDNCGDCNGYDYSNCDMNRCKNDCESCGGRRYICNNSCFNYRYDYALKLYHTDAYKEAIGKVYPYLGEILEPNNREWRRIYEEHKKEIDKVEDSCQYLTYCSYTDGEVTAFLNNCFKMRRLIHYRDSEDQPKIVVEIRSAGRSLTKVFRREETTAEGTHGGFLWLFDTGGTVTFNGYNSVDDQIQEYKLKLKKSEKYPNFVDDINNKNVSKIVVGPSDDNEKFEIISLIKSICS